MKKSLIALAVIGAFTAQAAMAAETTIYGAANVSFDAVSTGATANSASANGVQSNQSVLGFKGSEDLGDGLSAVWQIEEQVNFASSNGTATGQTNQNTTPFSGTSGFVARDTFAGLSSSSLGTLLVGIHATPYNMASRGMDMFANTVADNRSIMGAAAYGAIENDSRLNNVVAYVSPSFSGLTLAIASVTGADIPSASASNKGSAWSMAALYGAGPLNVNMAYQTITMGTAGTGTLGLGGPDGLTVCTGSLGTCPGDKTTAFKLDGGYTIDAFQVNAVYEKLGSSGSVGNALDRSSWYLAGKWNVTANDAVKAAYTGAGNINSMADTGVKQFSLGYDHNMSKHTTVYALYSRLSNDTNANYHLGMADATTSIVSGGAGSDPSVFSLGMKHAF